MNDKRESLPDNGVMLNAYPDSMGGSLRDIVSILGRPELKDAFRSFYILPSMYNSDLDRGFSVIDYELNELYATYEDIEAIRALGIDLKLDFVCNHLSVLSKQFQDILKNGKYSKYRDFFIDWNRFWSGNGAMTEQGYIQPDGHLTRDMFFRKPGLPLLMVRFPDGTDVPYWNTFYNETQYIKIDAQDLVTGAGIQYATAARIADIVNSSLAEGKKPQEIPFGPLKKYAAQTTAYLESGRKYLGQMDLNISSPQVWQYYKDTITKLADYGASIIRLDAFAYTSKKVGAKNFFNSPETQDLLAGLKGLADERGVELLPEIHSSYAEKTHEMLSQEGYIVYDFFLPGLLIDALERKDATRLAAWASELRDKKIRTVNMLGCHDGIPMLDLDGLIPKDEIEALIRTIVARGGHIKNLHGNKNMYYQVNATYYSALGEDDKKMLLSRAVQLFMPGKPQVWYLDLFLGKNNIEAVRRGGEHAHREINRTNLSPEAVEAGLKHPAVQNQLEMLRFRNTSPAFGYDSELEIETPSPHELTLSWHQSGHRATLYADLSAQTFKIVSAPIAGSENPTNEFRNCAFFD